jgi:hypothetical protein
VALRTRSSGTNLPRQIPGVVFSDEAQGGMSLAVDEPSLRGSRRPSVEAGYPSRVESRSTVFGSRSNLFSSVLVRDSTPTSSMVPRDLAGRSLLLGDNRRSRKDIHNGPVPTPSGKPVSSLTDAALRPLRNPLAHLADNPGSWTSPASNAAAYPSRGGSTTSSIAGLNMVSFYEGPDATRYPVFLVDDSEIIIAANRLGLEMTGHSMLTTIVGCGFAGEVLHEREDDRVFRPDKLARLIESGHGSLEHPSADRRSRRVTCFATAGSWRDRAIAKITVVPDQSHRSIQQVL